MCYFDQVRWACGSWRWGHFRQHCNKEYRAGKTCGLKLAYNTSFQNEPCKLCVQAGTEQRRWATMQAELERWRGQAQAGQRHSVASIQHRRGEIESINTEVRGVLKAVPQSHEAAIDLVVLQSMVKDIDGAARFLNEELEAALKQANGLQSDGVREIQGPAGQAVPNLENANSEERTQSPVQPGSKTRAYTAEIPRNPFSKTHPSLDFEQDQTRLLELVGSADSDGIEGVFHRIKLSECPSYVAVSYTWGEPGKLRNIHVGGRKIAVRENLWSFLRLGSSGALGSSKLLWIDAVCIDQSNIAERNHQIGLMKDIYANASEVLIWLGEAADDSDTAMEFVANSGHKLLRPKGTGFQRFWTRQQGKALLALCQRGYWRRMWIIQEIVYASKLVVCCGTRSFEWQALESIYHKLKIVELKRWITHHDHAASVLGSFACIMVWQRAKWRHPDTAKPSLRRLVEAFGDWQCSDPKDKVFSLLGLSDGKSGVVADYSLSPEEVFNAVMACQSPRQLGYRVATMQEKRFCELLRKGLELPPL